MKIKCFGKLNLALEILGKTSNNMHKVDMIMQTVNIFDILDIAKSNNISISCDTLKIDEKNTVFLAVKRFFAYTGIDGGITINIKKNIPEKAGLGGGSSDCAATLNALNLMYNAGLTYKELMGIGVRIGADVPFFLQGGTQRAQGIGDILTKSTNKCNFRYLLIKPKGSVCTKLCYDNYRNTDEKISIDKVKNALENGDKDAYIKCAKNALQKPALGICEEIETIIEECYKQGSVFTMMTGSGSCVFAVFGKDIEKAQEYFEKKQPYVCMAENTSKGYEIINFSGCN